MGDCCLVLAFAAARLASTAAAFEWVFLAPALALTAVPPFLGAAFEACTSVGFVAMISQLLLTI